MIVYKDQGINWHPQSDSLGVSPVKQTHSTPPMVSGLHCLVESLGQLTCSFGCFIARPLIDLTNKNLAWNWTPQCQSAFDSLKSLFLSKPILCLLSLLPLPPMHPNSPLAPCSSRPMPMANGIPAHISPNHSPPLRKTIIFITGNSSQSSKP